MIQSWYMPFYRSFDSDDQRAWDLTKRKWISMHSLVRVMLFAAIVLAVVLTARS